MDSKKCYTARKNSHTQILSNMKSYIKRCQVVCVLLCPTTQNCVWVLRFAYLRTSVDLYVRTTQNLVCATSPTPLDWFCSYPHTVTNMTWTDDRKDWTLRCCKFYMSFGTLSLVASVSYRHIILVYYTFKVGELRTHLCGFLKKDKGHK